MFRIPTIPRRFLLLLLILSMIGSGVIVAYVVRKQRIEQQILAKRDTGMAEYEKADFGAAMGSLGTYLGRYPQDVEALLAYGRCREQVKAKRNQHIPQAIGIYRRVLELDSTKGEVRRDLLRLYQLVGYHTETVAVADEILAADSADWPAVFAKCKALGAQRKYQDALTVAQKMIVDHPKELDAYLLAMQFMRELSQPAQSIVDFAKGFAARHPSDVRFELLVGVAYQLAGNQEQARLSLKKAAEQPIDDPSFYRVLVQQLDLLGEYAASTQALANAVKANASIEYRRIYATRLWQAGAAKELTELLKDVQPSDPAADSQLLVFKALALNQPETVQQARAIVEALAARPATDPVAVAWTPLFQNVLLVTSPDPRKVIEETDNALVKLPGEPHILFLRGTARLAVGETLRAVNDWQQASQVAPAWPLPRVRLARGFTQLGRGQDAMRAAIDALLRSPGSVQASVALALAWFSVDQKSERLLGLVEQIQEGVKGEEETLPIYITLLAGNGKTDKAKEKLAQLLTAEPLPSQPTMLRLAVISDDLKLDLGTQLLERTRLVQGISPPVSLYRAQRERRTAGNDAAMAIFKKDWDSVSGSKDNVGWRLTWASLLSEIDPELARKEWISLADAFPDNLQVQRLAGDVPAVQQDREFLDRVIERIRKQAGDEGTDWRMKRVRWLLARDNDKETAAQAAVLLREVLQMTFDNIAARRLLALCFQRMNNTPAAIEELQTAYKLNPHRIDLALELAGLLQSAGDFVKSRDLIDRVLDQQELSRRERQVAAQLLATQGATDIAIATLEAERDTSVEAIPGTASDILLARLYWIRKQPEKALPLFEALLAAGNAPDVKPNPLVIQMAANFFEDQGNHERAASTLVMLDKATDLPPGIRELLMAEHHSRAADKKLAAPFFEAALKAAPDNAAIWQLYAAHQIRQGKLDQAVVIIETALNRLPEEASLAFVKKKIGLIKRSLALDMNRLEPMVYAMITNPEHQEVAARILEEIVTSAESKGDINTLMSQLRRIADQTPRFLELQNLVASTYVLLNRPDEAARISMRAMETFPTASAPAAMNAAALAMGKRWREVIPAADAWLARAAGDIVRVDLLKAEALTQLEKPEEAIKLLAPHYAAGASDAKVLRDVTPFYLKALLAAKKDQQAIDTIVSLVKRDATWAVPLLEITFTASSDAVFLGKLLSQLETVVAPDAFEPRLALAVGRLSIFRLAGEASELSQARTLLEDLIQRKLVSANLHYVDAQVYEAQNKPEQAESAYRESIRLLPENPAAKNNLAMLLLRKPGTVVEAVKLAADAVKTVPRSANLRDTLAAAYLAAGQPTQAARELEEAVRLEPRDLKWQVRLVWALLESNDLNKAREFYKPLRSAIPTQQWTPDMSDRIEEIRKRLG